MLRSGMRVGTTLARPRFRTTSTGTVVPTSRNVGTQVSRRSGGSSVAQNGLMAALGALAAMAGFPSAESGSGGGNGPTGPSSGGVRNVPRGRKRRGMFGRNGRMKKAKRRKLKKKKRTVVSMTKCLTRGCTATQEVTLTESDPNVCYFVAAAQAPQQTINIIVQSLIRKLLEVKGGVQCIGQDSTQWPGFTYNNQGGWQIDLLEKNLNTGAVATADQYLVPNGSSIKTIANYFYQIFYDYSARFGYFDDLNHLELYGFNLYMTEINPPGAVTTTKIFKGQMLFADETCHIIYKNELKCQNRTLSADGSGNTDNVARNPIQGTRIDFPNLPKARDPQLKSFSIINQTNGIKSFGPSALGTAEGMYEPPNRRVFTNSKSQQKVMVAPGEIVRFTFGFKKSMKLCSMLKWIALNADTQSAVIDNHGPHIVLAFEDCININVDNEITVAAEINRNFGAYCTTSKQKAIIPVFISNVVT